MSKYIYIVALLLPLLPACSRDKEEVKPAEEPRVETIEGNDRYVLMTYDKLQHTYGGLTYQIMTSYVTYYGQMPNGSGISNIKDQNTLKGVMGHNGGGLLQSGNNLYRRVSSVNNGVMSGDTIINSPTRLIIPKTGRIREQIYSDPSEMAYSISYKQIALTPSKGYLASLPMRNSPYYITTFDPLQMQRSPENLVITSEDQSIIREKILEATPSLAGLSLPGFSVGSALCAIHGNTLIMDVELSTASGSNVSRDAYLVTYEAKHGGKMLGFSVIKSTGHLGNLSESLQHASDKDGNLYLLAQGTDPVGFYRNSLICRIKKGAYTIDDSWSVKVTDISSSADAIRFNGISVAGDKLITMINNTSLVSTSKDMNQENVWDYYAIDIATRKGQKIAGLESCSGFLTGANLIATIDNKHYLRYVRTGDKTPYNGYYLYEPKTGSVTPAFSVWEGGYVLDLKKITLDK